MPQLSPPKPHRTYPDLVALLESRGMIIPDKARAERKLSQIGYYRLSGFWYPCREIKKDQAGQYIIAPNTKIPVRDDSFQPNTNFNDIIELYLFDKKLRQLMLDAIERIEIHARSVIAHEMGYHDPLAYQDKSFINPKQCKTWKDKKGQTRNIWNQSFPKPLPVTNDQYFVNLNLSRDALEKMYGMICILWFLVKKIGPSSKWMECVAELVDSKPAIDCCPNTAMGFPDNTGFPRGQFGL